MNCGVLLYLSLYIYTSLSIYSLYKVCISVTYWLFGFATIQKLADLTARTLQVKQPHTFLLH